MPEASLLFAQPSLWSAAALTFVLAYRFRAARRRLESLPQMAPVTRPANAPLTDCMVVIPARNEEAMIGRAVRSLPHDTVIVVDDYSTDRTAEVAREAGAGVLTAPDLPRNGVGKPNACAYGASALTSEWVLFTDADTRFEPGFLDAAVACAESSGVSLLSIYLDPEYKGIAENILAPYARAIAFAGFSVSKDSRGMFRGQCLLVRREPYAFMGGHRSVMTQISEDLKFTLLAERHRMKTAIVRAPGLGHVRLYAGYRGIRSGIQRQAFRFMALSPAIGITILLFALAAALWLPLLLWMVWSGQRTTAWIFGFAPTALLLPWYTRRYCALFAPLAIYWILPSLAAGFFSAFFGRSIQWKGRTVRAVS